MLAAKHDVAKAGGPGEVFDKGLKVFLAGGQEKSKSDGYMWLVTAELGRALGQATLELGENEVAWYKDGAAKLLKEQHPSGSWALSRASTRTSCTRRRAACFLGPPQK